MADEIKQVDLLKPIMDDYKVITNNYPAHNIYNNVQKLITEVKELNNSLKSANIIAKRGLKKKINLKNIELTENVHKLNMEIASEFKAILEENKILIPKIAVIDKKVAEELKKLEFPLDINIKSLNKLSTNLKTLHVEIVDLLKQKDKVTILRIKDAVQRYTKYADINMENLKITFQYGEEDIDSLNLKTLLEVYHELENELKEVNTSLEGVEQKIELYIQTSIQQIISNIDISKSLKIDIPKDLVEDIQDFKKQTSKTRTAEGFLQIAKEFDEKSGQLTNLIRQQAYDIKSRCNLAINKITNIYGEEHSNKWLKNESENIVLDSEDHTILIKMVEKLNQWEKEILSVTKKNIVDQKELANVVQTMIDLELDIPENIIEISKEKNTVIQSSKNLISCLDALDDYESKVRSEVSEYLREPIKNMIKLPIEDIPEDFPAPVIDLKTNNPKLMLEYYQDTKQWFSNVSKGLRETHINIKKDIGQLNKVNLKGVTIPSELIDALQKIRTESKGIDDIQRLGDLRKQYISKVEEASNIIRIHFKDTLSNVHIIRLLELENTPSPPDLENIDDFRFKDLLNILNDFDSWQKDVIKHLISDLNQREYPLIPIETSLDLKRDKTNVIEQLSTKNTDSSFRNKIKEYLTFIDLEISTKALILREIREMIQRFTDDDQESDKIFNTVPHITVPPILMGSKINEIGDKDYSELLEVWYVGKGFLNRRKEKISDISFDYLDARIKEFSSFPGDYLKHFEEVITVFKDGKEKLNNATSVAEIFNTIQSINSNSLYSASTHIERLRGQLYNHLMVILPRIRQAIGNNLPREIESKAHDLGSSPTTYNNLDRAVRATQELIHTFLYEIVAELTQLLGLSSRDVLSQLSKLKEDGINLYSVIADPFEKLSQILTTGKEILSLEEIVDGFDQITEIIYNEIVARKIRESIDKEINMGQKAISLVPLMGHIYDASVLDESNSNLIGYQGYLSSTRGLANLSEMHGRVFSISSIIRNEIVSIEEKSYLYHENNYKKQFYYYSTFLEIFQEDMDLTCEDIFPYKDWQDTRSSFREMTSLSYAPDLMQKLFDFRKKWEEEILPTMSKWHRVLPIVISMFDPSKDLEFKSKHLEEIITRIRSVYSHKPMQTYLSLALRVYSKQFQTKKDN